MFNYFTKSEDILQYPVKKYFKWNLIRRMYQTELDKLKEYYRDREYNYNNNSILVKLVNLLKRDVRLDPLDYFSYIEIDYPYIEKQLNIVSNLHPGEPLEDVIFNHGSKEVFLSVDNAVDPYEMENSWRDYPSLRVIYTPIDNVYYPIPFDYEYRYTEYSYFEIDTKALLLQYYYWAKERLAQDRDIAPNVFIPTVVLPNLADSLSDYAVWNRFKKIYFKEKIEDNKIDHAQYVIDYTKGIDDVLKEIADDIRNSKLYITQMLETVNVLINQSSYQTLRINKTNYNRQSEWVLWLTRLPEIVDIHKILGGSKNKHNLELFNLLPYEVRLMRNRETAWRNKLDKENYKKIKEYIKYIDTHIGKR